MARRRSSAPKVFDKILNRLNQIDLNRPAEEMFDKLIPEIEDYNVEQLNKGIKSDGNRIKPEYRPKTVIIKQKKGQPTDRVTLKDYGDFHNQIRVKKYATKFELVSYDEKSEKLQEKYTPDILGITNENLAKIRLEIFNKLQKDVKRIFKV